MSSFLGSAFTTVVSSNFLSTTSAIMNASSTLCFEIVLPVEECEEMKPEEYQYYSMPEVNDEEIRITVRESRYHDKDGYVFRSEDRGKTWEYTGKQVDEFYYDKEE